jgi:hypothetical protein
MTPYIPVISKTTRKYWKRYIAHNLPRMHYIIVHSSSHRKPSCLLIKTPCTRSKPKILSHMGLSIGSKIPFLPVMHSKKAIWLTFPPPSKSTFPLRTTSSKKSSLELLALLRKLSHIKPSSRNTGTFSPGHTRRCLVLTHLLSNIASTPSLTSHQFTRNNDRYTLPRPRLSKPKLTNYVGPDLFIPSLTLHGFPTLYSSTKNKALSAFSQNFVISIMHVQKKTSQRLSSTRLSTTALATRLSPLWMDSLAITKFKSTKLINTKPHSLPLGVLSHIVSCLLA